MYFIGENEYVKGGIRIDFKNKGIIKKKKKRFENIFFYFLEF